MKKYNRQSIRLKNWDYSRPMRYFVTLVLQNRKPWFGKNDHGVIRYNSLGRIAHDEWLKSAQIRDEIKICDFIIMPDHVHGIVEITDNASYRNGLNPDEYRDFERMNWIGFGTDDVGANGHSPQHHQHPHPHPHPHRHSHQHPGNMPIIIPPKKPKSLSTFIIGYKSAVTSRVNELMVKHDRPVFTRKNRLWQRNYYDRIIWNDEIMVAVQRYIQHNPRSHSQKRS